jgi:hypothetical protein
MDKSLDSFGNVYERMNFKSGICIISTIYQLLTISATLCILIGIFRNMIKQAKHKRQMQILIIFSLLNQITELTLQIVYVPIAFQYFSSLLTMLSLYMALMIHLNTLKKICVVSSWITPIHVTRLQYVYTICYIIGVLGQLIHIPSLGITPIDWIRLWYVFGRVMLILLSIIIVNLQ